MTPRPLELDASLDRLTFGASRLGFPTPTAPLAFGTIVAGVAGDESTASVLGWTRRLAASFGSRVALVGVVRPAFRMGDAGAGLQWEADTRITLQEETAMTSLLETSADEMREAKIAVETVLASGSPPLEIERAARQRHADLVVVGASRRGPVARALLGNVADALKGSVDASVLVVKSHPWPRRIVAPVDGSSTSRRAAHAALRIARGWRVPTTLLHVVEPPFGTAGEGREALDVARAAALAFQDEPLVDALIEFGSPAERIARVAGDRDAGLVVIGSRGLGGLHAAMLGSVSHTVLHLVDASVLLVKPGPP